MELQKRKSLRLKNFDYSQNGGYFITVCTHNRLELFGRIVGSIHESTVPMCQLSQYGQIVEQVIQSIPSRFPTIEISKYIIMPNHIHLIVHLQNPEIRAIRESPLQEKRSALAKLMGYLKMNVSKQIHKLSPEQKVWQRSYYEHGIRNQKSYEEIWDYIDTNPAKWQLDEYYQAP